MFYQRKSVDNAWFSCRLNKEEICEVQTVAIVQGLNILININKTAAKNNIKLNDADRAALLNFAALTLESFSSDAMEARIISEKSDADKKSAQTSQ